jgi:hypothetical protein
LETATYPVQLLRTPGGCVWPRGRTVRHFFKSILLPVPEYLHSTSRVSFSLVLRSTPPAMPFFDFWNHASIFIGFRRLIAFFSYSGSSQGQKARWIAFIREVKLALLERCKISPAIAYAACPTRTWTCQSRQNKTPFLNDVHLSYSGYSPLVAIHFLNRSIHSRKTGFKVTFSTSSRVSSPAARNWFPSSNERPAEHLLRYPKR